MRITQLLTRVFFTLALSLAFANMSHAAVWIKLQDNAAARLMVDKQSILSLDNHERAWVKIDYKALQSNVDYPEKTYNNAKMLWFFDCNTQKSATTQVFQYLDEDLVYSAAVELKAAKFNEPVPESEVDTAMRYVCKTGQVKPKLNTTAAGDKEDTKKPVGAVDKNVQKNTEITPAKSADEADQVADKLSDPANKSLAAAALPAKIGQATAWSYDGKTGPLNWAKLNPEYASCDAGHNQSPINIDKTLPSAIKPLKTLQRFPASNIINDGRTLQINFKEGNIVVVDGMVYKMKQMHFHLPSENTIHGKSYPLEAHFLHADAKGNLAMIAVMFEEGAENKAISRIWEQLPSQIDKPMPLKSRTLPSELIPQNKPYYRFSGSLTTPPCTEGVVWIVMKTPMTISKAQLASFKEVMHENNNRPIQALNGRLVVE